MNVEFATLGAIVFVVIPILVMAWGAIMTPEGEYDSTPEYLGLFYGVSFILTVVGSIAWRIL